MSYDLNNGSQEYYITAACIVLFMGSLWAYWHYLNDKHKRRFNADDYDDWHSEEHF